MGCAQWCMVVVDPLGGLGYYLSGTSLSFQQEDLGGEEGAPGVQKSATLDVRFRESLLKM